MRVLLVYANPHQALPVSPYGLEILKAAAIASGLPVDIKITNPFIESLEEKAYLAALLEDFRPHLIGLSVRNLDNAVVALRPELADDQPVDVVGYADPVRSLVITLKEHAPTVPVIVGGAVFGACPTELLDFLGLPIGVVGPGEHVFVEILRGLIEAGGRPSPAALAALAAGLPGTVVRHGDGFVRGRPDTAVLEHAVGQPEIAPEYVMFGALRRIPAAVRTKAGCPLRCAYCVDHVNLRRVGVRPPAEVRAEIEHYIVAYGVRSFHFADPEVNLPYEDHLIDVCEGLAASPYAGGFNWHGYFNVRPCSDRLIDALRRSGCTKPGFAVDAFDDRMLAGHQKNFRTADVDDLMRRIVPVPGMRIQIGVLFGQPGETRETIAAGIRAIRRLAADGVEVGYSCGLRVYPGTPLARRTLDPAHRYARRDASNPIHPQVYCEPLAPRDLAAWLADELADLPGVGAIDEGPILEARQPPWLRPFNVGLTHLAHRRLAAADAHFQRSERAGGARAVEAAMTLALGGASTA